MRFLLVLSLVLIPALAPAQTVYRWVDEDGNPHYTGSLRDVPEKHRAAATRTGPASAPTPKPKPFHEISHPQGYRMRYTDEAKCRKIAAKLSETHKRTVSCYPHSD